MKFQPMKQQEVSAMRSSLILVAMVLVLCASSCSQCEDCELNGNTERICETEFDNTDQYQDAIADKEAAGASCTAVGF